MKKGWLAIGLLCGLGLWIASSSGCGAKSTLLIDDEEEEERETEPPPPPPVDCDSDRDCNDGDYCNGFESCVEGVCVDGDPVDCGDGDECHMAYCDEDRERCVDMLIAEDRDGDGHFARPCGDDCDDTDPSVYPGAREICNGVDDDCNGEVDEDLVEACEDYGRRTCRDGRWTECADCTVCIPGSMRYCDTPTYCSWGVQYCRDDGDGWGECLEGSPPPGCSGWGFELDCCMSVGACCQDYFDYDGDGDYNDNIGACEDAACPGARD